MNPRVTQKTEPGAPTPYPDEPASPELLASLAEFERLAQRCASPTEAQTLERALAGADIWVEGLRPEAIASLAAALSCSGLDIFLISAHADLLRARQHRFARRGPTVRWLPTDTERTDRGALKNLFLCPAQSLSRPKEASRFWNRLSRTARPLVIVEDAHALEPSSFETRPVFERLAAGLAERPHIPCLLAAARGDAAAREAWRASATRALPEALREALPDVVFRVVGAERWIRPPGEEAAAREACSRRSGSLTDTSPRAASQDAARGGPGRPLARQLELADAARIPESEVVELIAELPRPALILCGTPVEADALFACLCAEQVPCHRYHRGMSRSERASELVRFALPGRRAVLVATSAHGPSSGLLGGDFSSDVGDPGFPDDFGLGYGRGDLRSIVHFSLPASLPQLAREWGVLHPTIRTTSQPDPEAWDEEVEAPFEPEAEQEPAREDSASALAAEPTTQETATTEKTASEHRKALGDDPPLTHRHATLILAPQALADLHTALDERRPRVEDLHAVAQALLGGVAGGRHEEHALLQEAGQGIRRGGVLLELLSDEGVVSRHPGQVEVQASAAELRRAVERLERRITGMRRGDHKRTEQLAEFLVARQCRLVALSHLLGEPVPEPCGKCDCCEASPRGAQLSVVGPESRASKRDDDKSSPAARRRAPVSRRGLGDRSAGVKPRLVRSPPGRA